MELVFNKNVFKINDFICLNGWFFFGLILKGFINLCRELSWGIFKIIGKYI